MTNRPLSGKTATEVAPSASGVSSGYDTGRDVEKQTDTVQLPSSGSTPNADGGQNEAREEAPREDPNILRGHQFWLLMFAVTLSVWLMALTATVLGTATPSITSDFHSINDVGWYSAAYLISNAALAPFTGKLYRLFRLKLTMITFIVIFLIGSAIAGGARSSSMLIGARAICGMGGSGIFMGGMTCIAASTPTANRSLLNGILMGFFAVGQAIGPLIGGALTTYASWRWCFFINLPIGGIAIFLIGFIVKLPTTTSPEDNAKSLLEKISEIDLIGFVFFTIGIVLFLMGLEWGGTTYAWNSSMVIGLMVGGGISFLILIGWILHKKEEALMPTRLFKNRINNAIGLTAFVQSGGVFTALYWLPIWFQSVKNASAMKSGEMILPLILSQLLFSVLGGALVQKTGYYLPEVLVGSTLIAIAAGLLTTLTPSTTTGEWVGYEIIVGCGRGFILQLLVTAIQANVPKEDVSIATALVMFCQFFGGSIFSCVAKTIFTSSIPAAVEKYVPALNPNLLIDIGATELHKDIPSALLSGALLAYNKCIDNVFYLQLAASCAAFVTGLGMGWVNLKQVDAQRAAAARNATQETAEDTIRRMSTADAPV